MVYAIVKRGDLCSPSPSGMPHGTHRNSPPQALPLHVLVSHRSTAPQPQPRPKLFLCLSFPQVTPTLPPIPSQYLSNCCYVTYSFANLFNTQESAMRTGNLISQLFCSLKQMSQKEEGEGSM
jgi:hypothetical protein